jgi:hypothetical protein
MTKLNLLLQEAGFETNMARGFAEALAEDQNFSRQPFAAQTAKLTRELARLRLAFWWSAAVILAGVVGLEVWFRLMPS